MVNIQLPVKLHETLLNQPDDVSCYAVYIYVENVEYTVCWQMYTLWVSA